MSIEPKWYDSKDALVPIASFEQKHQPVSCPAGSGWMTAQWIKVKNLFSKEGVVNELQNRILNNAIDGETLRWFSTGQLKALYTKMKTSSSQVSDDICKVFDKALHIAASRGHSREKQAALLSLYSIVPENIRNQTAQSITEQFGRTFASPLSQVLGAPPIERHSPGTVAAAFQGPPSPPPGGSVKPKRLPTEAEKEKAAEAAEAAEAPVAPKAQEKVVVKEVILEGASPKDRYSHLTAGYSAQLTDAFDASDKMKCREYLGKVFDMPIEDSHFNPKNMKAWREVLLGTSPDGVKAGQFMKLYSTAKGQG